MKRKIKLLPILIFIVFYYPFALVCALRPTGLQQQPFAGALLLAADLLDKLVLNLCLEKN